MRFTNGLGGSVLCGALLGLGACAGPGVSPQAMSMQHDAMAVLATADRGEIEEAQLALQRSQNASVRAYAQRMVSEHTADLQMQNAMMSGTMSGTSSSSMHGDMSGMSTSGSGSMSTSGSMSGSGMSGSMSGDMAMHGSSDVVSSLQSGHQQAMAMLSGLSGAAFDRAYMQRQVDAHSYLLSYTNWLMGAQSAYLTNGEPAMVVGSSLDASGRCADATASDVNATPAGSCAGVAMRHMEAMEPGHVVTSADVANMNANARAMISSHLAMAQQTLSSVR